MLHRIVCTILIAASSSSILFSQEDHVTYYSSEMCRSECGFADFNVEDGYTVESIDVISADCDPQLFMSIAPDGEIIECPWSWDPNIPECNITVVTTVTGPNGATTEEVDSFSIFVFGETTIFPIISDACEQIFVDSTRASCDLVCEGAEVTYYLDQEFFEQDWTIQGSGEIIFEDRYSITVVWTASGEGSVIFTYSDECGTGTVDRCVQILSPPVAAIGIVDEMSPYIFCRGEEVFFENLTTGGMTYHWDFGDGTTSDAFEPSHKYSVAGVYDITLSASAATCECSHDTTITIEVLEAAAPELECIGTLCPGDTGRYVAVTDGCMTYQWTVIGDYTLVAGGGSSDDFIDVLWHDGPEGIIELLVSDCNTVYCDEPTRFRIPVIAPDGPLEGDAYVCSGEVVTYHAPDYPGATYTWSVSHHGTVLSDQNPSSNTFTIAWPVVNSVVTDAFVTVDYDHCYLGCGGQDRLDVQIVPTLVIDGEHDFCMDEMPSFSAITSYATGSPVICDWQLIDDLGGQAWASSSGDDDVTIPLTFPSGTYTLIAEAVDPTLICNPTAEHVIHIYPLPDPPMEIIADSFVCPDRLASFEITNMPGNIAYFDFIDGTTTTTERGPTAAFRFTSSGPYEVRAYYESLAQGCISAPLSRTFTRPMNRTIAGPAEACQGNAETYAIDLPDDWPLDWEVIPAEAGAIRAGTSPVAEVVWQIAGTHELRVNTCGEVFTYQVQVHPLPQPDVIHPAILCGDESSTISLTESYVGYRWLDASDQQIGISSTIDLGPGFYGVEVTDANGCVGSARFEIGGYLTPEARLSTPDDPWQCGTMNALLVAVTNGSDYTFEWFRDGVSIGHTAPTYQALDTGFYHYVVTNSFGCTATSNTLWLRDYCQDCNGGVCNGNVCNGDTCIYYGDITFNTNELSCSQREYRVPDLSIFEPGSIYWEWEAEDGNFYFTYEDTLDRDYYAAGYYTVILRGRLDGFNYPGPRCYHVIGLIDTIPAAAYFISSGVCVGESIAFEDKSVFLPDHSITAWAWDFGDGSTSTDQNPMHTYTSTGTYDVTLQITASTGCLSTITQSIAILGNDGGQIAVDDALCAGQPTYASLVTNGKSYYTSWNYGDPSTDVDTMYDQVDIAYAYPSAGNYTIRVDWENVFGCQADTFTAVDINDQQAIGRITVAPDSVICEGETTTLSAPTGGVRWLWSTGDTTADIVVSEQDYYEVEVTDVNGCYYHPPAMFIEVLPEPPIDVRGRELMDEPGPWTDQLEVCEGSDIELEGLSIAGATYMWGDGILMQRRIFTDEAGNSLGAGTHVFTVQATDSAGCTSAWDTIIVIVHPNPQSVTVQLSSGDGCSNGVNVLTVSPTLADHTYEWSNGMMGSTIEVTHAGEYTVTVTNTHGCQTASNNSVTINQGPNVDLFPAGCYIKCYQDTICIPNFGQSITYYEIRLDGSVVSSGSTIPSSYIATMAGSYTLYAQTSNGCEAESDVLQLDLRPGYGDISVTVYADADGDGVISSADTVMQDIIVNISQGGVWVDSVRTDALGEGHFIDLSTGDYLVTIDRDALDSAYHVLIDSLMATIAGCGVIEELELLIGPKCTQDTTTSARHTLCHGDSVIIAGVAYFTTGMVDELLADAQGCDSTVRHIITVEDSLFSVTTHALCPGDSVVIANMVYYDADTVMEVVASADGCDSTIHHYISITDTIAYEAVIEGTCPGEQTGSIIMVVDPSVTIVWDHDGSTSLTITDLDSGYYTFTLMNGSCQHMGQVYVPVVEPPSYTLLMTDPDCPGEEGQVSIISDASDLQWGVLGASLTSDTTIDLMAGSHTVIIGDDDCFDTTDVLLEEPSLPSLSLEGPVEVFIGQDYIIQHSLMDSVGYTYTWSPSDLVSCDDCTTPTYVGTTSGTVQVIATTPDGCELTGAVLINIIDARSTFVPTAFSPNNDGVNDHFMPFVHGGRATLMQVFDRWGNMVYQEVADVNSDTDFNGWNGKSPEGDDMPVDVYVYKVNVVYEDGESRMIVGDVAILK